MKENNGDVGDKEYEGSGVNTRNVVAPSTMGTFPSSRQHAGSGKKKQYSRTVSYTELQQLGLSRAVDEYHKLLNCKKVAWSCQQGGEACPVYAMKRVLLSPGIMQPEAVLWLVCRMFHVMMVVLRGITVVAVPYVAAILLGVWSMWGGEALKDGQCFDVWPFVFDANGKGQLCRDRCNVYAAFGGLFVLFVSEGYTRRRRFEACCKALDSISRPGALEELYGPLVTVCSKRSNIAAVINLQGDTSSTAEEELFCRVQQLVAKYGFKDVAHAERITSMDVAVRWINKLAHELEEERFQSRTMSVKSAIEAVDALSNAIGLLE